MIVFCGPVSAQSGVQPTRKSITVQGKPAIQLEYFKGAPIKGIESRGPITLHITGRSTTGVKVEVPDEISEVMEYINIDMDRNGIVIIELRNLPTALQRRYEKSLVQFVVYTDEVNVLKISGVAQVSCSSSGFKGNTLDLSVSVASKLTGFNHTASGYSKINCDGASHISFSEITGSSVHATISNASYFEPVIRANKDLVVNLSGASKAKGGFWSAGDARFTVSGASNADIDLESAAGTAYVTVIGASGFRNAINCARFVGEVSGSSSFNAKLTCSSVAEFLVRGSSGANVSGKTHELRLTVNGSSNFRGNASFGSGNFSANLCDARINGASGANLTVVSELKADVSGASSFRYSGNPRIREQVVTSGSSIRQQ